MLLDDRVTIATPEGVSLELVLAGVGSRFVARLLDTLIQGTIILALGIVVYVVPSPGIVRAIARILVFVVLFGYDIPFEVLKDGRTIGKSAAGIRVVGARGEPVSFLASAIRNIMRLFDFLPLLYVIGVVSIVASHDDQRLGDLAAGTVVVRDRFPGLAAMRSAPVTVPAYSVASWDVSAVDAAELATIQRFLDRRLDMAPHVRGYFAARLAADVAPKVTGAPYGAHPEYLLEGVVVAKQART